MVADFYLIAPASAGLSARRNVTTSDDNDGKGSTRLHYLDAFRVSMLMLGIPFHASDIFRDHSEWLISSPVGSTILPYFIQTVHSFRMFAFFMVSGYFSALVLSRKPAGEWLRGRASRLGIPLVAATIILGFAERAIIALYRYQTDSHGSSYSTLLHNLISTSSAGVWIFHRWFLVDLLIFSVVLAGAAACRVGILANRDLPGSLRAVERYPILLSALIVAVLAIYGVADAAPFRVLPREVLDGALRLDWLLAHAAPFFLGVVLFTFPAIMESLTSNLIRASIFAAAALAIYLSVVESGEGVRQVVYRLAILPCGFSCSIFALALCRKFFLREVSGIRALSEGAFTIYLVHVGLVLLFCQPFILLHVHPLLSAVATALLAGAGAYGVYALAKRVPWTGWVLNGAPFKPAR